MAENPTTGELYSSEPCRRVPATVPGQSRGAGAGVTTVSGASARGKVTTSAFLRRPDTRDRLPKEVFASEPSRSRAPQERPCHRVLKPRGSLALVAEVGLPCPRRSVDPLGSAKDHSGWQAARALSRHAP